MPPHSEILSLPVSAEAFALITLAAKENGVSPAEFSRQAALDLAYETLIDRTSFTLSASEFDAFEHRLAGHLDTP